MKIIDARDIEKTYPDGTRALRGISFSIEEGMFVAIMGPSGSGKSTLLHILGFLDKETDGTYLFDGKSMKDYSEDEIAHVRNKKMGFVFQMFNLLPRTSVLDNVKLPLIYSDVKESEWDKKAFEAIESVGMSHRMHHDSSRLSGGEKQRAAMARALVNNPQIIFADEPTGNLDSKSGEMVMETLQKLNDRGHTIILITHETYTAEHAERIIHIRDGRVDSDTIVNNRNRVKDFTK
ncbi:ABC transporter ATP-binding protein [Patescibacteria group bacterium]|nr:ABC transporter ATP-binding protein [Patescibacteria group bacterium]